MKPGRSFLVVLLLGAACAPATAPVPVLPEFVPLATAQIASSYPTAQAVLGSPDQSANGIQVRMERVWQDGKNLNADACFSMPDASDWSIWSATLSFGDLVLHEYGTTLVSRQDPAGGQPGQRCDTVTFVVAPDADLLNGTITIEAIAAYPREDEYCSIYMPKIQQAMVERGIAITLECQEANGAATMQIVSHPPEMTLEQAQEIVFSDEFYSVRGPWTFAFSLVP
jgi:hypothetical protein